MLKNVMYWFRFFAVLCLKTSPLNLAIPSMCRRSKISKLMSVSLISRIDVKCLVYGDRWKQWLPYAAKL